MSVTLAEVWLWGTRIGAVRWETSEAIGAFEYDVAFRSSGIEVAPLLMPLGAGVHSFRALERETFKGLPGMLADSLPDKFGSALIDAWLARQGRSAETFSPVERLCYVGSRGMGALEFAPAIDTSSESNTTLDIAHLVSLAQQAMMPKALLAVTAPQPELADLSEIIRVGTSAGGARAKAVVTWNEGTNEIRSGQTNQPSDFTHWLLKFDGVSANRDKELADPLGFGRVEHAYAEMARAARITMPRTRLLEEGGRAHFMTQRFDRVDGDKLHMQSLNAIAHYDFNMAGAYSYEQALQVMRRLRLPHNDLVQQFRRAVFNIVARNQDDHTKNISFLMDRRGTWSLSPAYDITYSYNPDGAWTSSHQMTLNGKRDDFTRDDIANFASAADLSAKQGMRILDEIIDTVASWKQFASSADVDPAMASDIHRHLRLTI